MNWSHPAYEKIARQLKARTGLYFSETRRKEAETGIERAMMRAGVDSPDGFADMIVGDGQIIDDLVVEMAVTESYFFREPRQFEMIRNEVLPEIRGRLGPDHTIRAWSAGCAAGQEAYSLAIVFEQEGLGDRARILATDIMQSALEQACQGTYNAWAVRNGALELARGRLQLHSGACRVDERLRRLVTFRRHNLALDLYPSEAGGIAEMDLILCRNVLIYFDSSTVRTVAERLFDSLTPGGWLVTASTDPPLGNLAPYETVHTSAGIVYRRPSAIVRRALREPSNQTVATIPARREEGRTVDRSKNRPTEATRPTAIAAEGLEAAEAAYAAGDYRLASQLAARRSEESDGCILRVRALANFDSVLAEQTCESATRRHPLNAELHYLHAVLLIGQGREEEAIDALRRVTYLDRAQPLAHFTLGSVLQRRGNLAAARRAYRNVLRLCRLLPPDMAVPLSDAESVARLGEAAAACIAEIDATQENVR